MSLIEQFHNFSLDQHKRFLEEFQNVDPRKVSYDEYVNIFKILMTNNTIIDLKLSGTTDKYNDYGFFRVRKVEDHLFDKTSELWSKPPCLSTSMGRCNLKDESVLYCSNHFTTALVECRAKENSEWVLVKYDIYPQHEALVILLGVTLEEYLGDRELNQFEKKLIDEVQSQKTEKQLSTDLFIKNSFTEKVDAKRESYKYKKTNAIIEVYTTMDAIKGKPYIISYPSVQSGNKGINFAFHRSFENSLLYIKRCYYLKVKSIDLPNGTVQFSFIADGNINNNRISWTQNTNNPFGSYKKA